MHPVRHPGGPGLAVLGLAAALVGPAAGRAEPFPPDPVERLVQTLAVERLSGNDPDQLAFKAELEQRLDALKSLGEMGRALTLAEWTHLRLDPKGAELEREAFKQLAGRFEKAVRTVAEGKDAAKQQALGRLIAEMAAPPSPESPRSRELASAFAALTPSLVKLTRSGDEAVAAAAARSLGRVGPDPSVAVPELKRLLGADGAGRRLAAAEALGDLTQGALSLTQQQLGGRPEAANGADLAAEAIKAAAATAPAAADGAADADPRVRRLCLEALKYAAAAGAELCSGPADAALLPPEGKRLTDAEQKLMEALRKAFEQERQALRPLTETLDRQVGVVGKALADGDATVSLAAHQALEGVCVLRRRLLRQTAALPAAVRKAADAKAVADPLPAAAAAAAKLAAALEHKEIRVRLAGLYALEALEADAEPAAPALIKALEDADVFVRWGAARALGKMAPHGGKAAALALAERLNDKSADVRLTAAAALERFGPAARDAVRAISRTVQGDDPSMRVRAIQVLAAVGTDAKSEVPVLRKALEAKESSVRLAAAQALAKFGPADKPTAAALQKALDDADPEVRRAAADALLVE
jgi:HEAT repeat protein